MLRRVEAPEGHVAHAVGDGGRAPGPAAGGGGQGGHHGPLDLNCRRCCGRCCCRCSRSLNCCSCSSRCCCRCSRCLGRLRGRQGRCRLRRQARGRGFRAPGRPGQLGGVDGVRVVPAAALGQARPLVANGAQWTAIAGKADALIVAVAELEEVRPGEGVLKSGVDVEVRVETYIAAPCHEQALVVVPSRGVALALEVHLLQRR
mmetsp:Transcript_86552/g.258307  ORF Transcript_86552/g.258307 Transcript_86552/m.258307 type:complete len:203 (+) Transcript_86552:617-1225(+)